MNIDRIPLRQHPKLFDKLIQELQVGLADNLPWLAHSFGKAERLVKEIKWKRYFTPNLYIGYNEYMNIEPDSRLGNYSFFTLDEPQVIRYARGERNHITAPYSLIFWLDLRKIPDKEQRNTESVKAEILHVLNGMILPREGRFSVTNVYEKAENVFQGFTLDEIDNQYLMHPYCAFRFTGEMEVEDECYL